MAGALRSVGALSMQEALLVADGPVASALGFGGVCMTFDARPAMTRWNDAPQRTIEEVLDRLESSALALEIKVLATESVKEESVVESSIPQPVASAV
jgi:hypothetical protein